MSASAVGIAVTEKLSPARKAGIESNPDAPLTPPVKGLESCVKMGAHLGPVTTAAVDSSGTLLATGSSDATVKLWSLTDYSLSATLSDHEGPVNSLAFSADGKWLASGGNDKKVRIWSLSKLGDKPARTINAHDEPVNGLVFTPDGKYLISCSSDRSIRLWSMPKGRLAKRFITDTPKYCVAIAPDGGVLAVGARGGIELWSLAPSDSGTLISTIEDLTGSIISVAISPDGKRIAAACWSDTQVKIWSLPDGKLQKSLQADSARVTGVAFSQDGKYLASCGEAEHAKVWKASNLKLKKNFNEGSEYVSCIGFAERGKLLITGYTGMTAALRIWGAKRGDLKRCLIDLKASYRFQKGITYKYQGAGGKWVTVTVPNCQCSTPIQGGAICECDTVAGKLCTCVGDTCGCHGVHIYYYPN